MILAAKLAENNSYKSAIFTEYAYFSNLSLTNQKVPVMLIDRLRLLRRADPN